MAESDDWLARWVSHHATLFQFTSPADAAMLAAWKRLITAEGWAEAELMEASDHLSLSPPRFRTDHLAALGARIRDRRAQRRRAEQESRDAESPDCAHGHCGGTGWVEVPHLRAVKDGEWVENYTAVVYCTCARGRWLDETNRIQCDEAKLRKLRRLRGLSLEEYTVKNPDWGRQLRRREEQREARHHAGQEAQAADARLGPLGQAVRQVLNQLPPPAKGG